MSQETHDINAAALAFQYAKRVVTVSHRQPDGDTLGAMLAASEALEAQGKEVHRFCIDKPGDSLAFLPGCELVQNNQAVFNGADTVIIFDAGDLRFACIDQLVTQLTPRPRMVNVDHHATNERFGDVNVIATDAASTTEVVYRILRTLNWRITPSMATNLLAGLVVDTMLFFNPATTSSALKLAAELERFGGDLPAVARGVMRNKSVDTLILWGKALERIKFDPVRSHVSTIIRENEIAGSPTLNDAIGEVSNFLNSNMNARTVLVLMELGGGIVKGSLRTAREDVDVAAEALAYGGGGHRKAAGYRVKGRVVEKENEWTIEIA